MFRGKYALLTAVLALPALASAQVVLTGEIRDFKGAFTSDEPFTAVTGGHPHFEVFTINNIIFGPNRTPPGYNINQVFAKEPGIVGGTIGADRNPVWVGGTDASLFPTTKTRLNSAGTNLEIETDDDVNRANFAKWFSNDPINQTGTIELTLTDPDSDGVYTYQNDAFFPLDGTTGPNVDVDGFTGFGDEGREHNYHFTIEFHEQFTYQTGQQFTFTGDDDVWVFINDQLVIDLGGIHQELSETVDLDTLGLTVGETYDFDFFFAERNTFESHFRIDTSIASLGDGVEPPLPPHVIPLPAAAWTGLLLLGGLGVGKRLRRRLSR